MREIIMLLRDRGSASNIPPAYLENSESVEVVSVDEITFNTYMVHSMRTIVETYSQCENNESCIDLMVNLIDIEHQLLKRLHGVDEKELNEKLNKLREENGGYKLRNIAILKQKV